MYFFAPFPHKSPRRANLGDLILKLVINQTGGGLIKFMLKSTVKSKLDDCLYE